MSDEAHWPGGAGAAVAVTSCDGGVRARVAVQKPDRYRYFRKSESAGWAIPRGAGLSFSAASFGLESITIDLSAFDRILGFDNQLGTVDVEAGLSLGALFGFLEQRGFYLPVQPGYPAITVGGCIAADVHGKNAARDGTFISQVEWVQLFHPSHGLVKVSRDSDADLFLATCGGFGLTGVIVSTRLRAQRQPAKMVRTVTHPVSSLYQAVEKLESLLDTHAFALGWHDLTRCGPHFGEGYIMASDFVDAAAAREVSFVDRKALWRARRALPFSVLNPVTVRAMNIGYDALSRFSKVSVNTLFQAMFPFYGKEGYFSLFGPAGFHEYQVIVPRKAFENYVRAIEAAARRTGAVICFAALKMFSGRSDLIRFEGAGVSLAIHVARTSASPSFLDAMDREVVGLGCLPNLIKDSRLPRSVFDATYAESDRFRAIVQAWDPKRLFQSSLSRRLGL